MSARSFGSLFMVASCAGAALGCYLVSLRVASERATLEGVEAQIVSTQSDLRLLQTEIGTRGRLSQLERWNASFALAAPAATQFVPSSFELAKLTQPVRPPNFQAPVVLAAAPEPQRPQIGAAATDDSGAPAAAASPTPLLHEASLKTEAPEVRAQAAAATPRSAAPKPAGSRVTAAEPAPSRSTDKPALAGAKSAPSKVAAAHAAEPLKTSQKKSVDKVALASAKPVTKQLRLAKTDPLAPLPDKHSGKTKDAPTGR
jgi:hypothetical protein